MQLFEAAQTLDRYADKKLVESTVDLLIGDIAGNERAYLSVEFVDADKTFFKHAERSGLAVFSKKGVCIGQPEAHESVDASLFLNIHYYSAEVEKQIFNFHFCSVLIPAGILTFIILCSDFSPAPRQRAHMVPLIYLAPVHFGHFIGMKNIDFSYCSLFLFTF